MPKKELNILLIEDNPGDVRLIKEYLKESGMDYKLTITDRVSNALIEMKQDHDIILTDLGLPDSSGLETLKKLKETGTSVPIIILTGLNNEEIALISIREGAKEYITKNSLDSNTLISGIKNSLERKLGEEKNIFIKEIIEIIDRHEDLKEIKKDVVDKIRSFSSIDIIGFRLKINEDYPFDYQDGYSDLYIKKYNSIIKNTSSYNKDLFD